MIKKVPAGVLAQLELALELGRVDPAGTAAIIDDAAEVLPRKDRKRRLNELLLTVSKKRRAR